MGVESIRPTGILPARGLTGSTEIIPRPGLPGDIINRVTSFKDPKPAPPKPGTTDPKPPTPDDDPVGPLTR